MKKILILLLIGIFFFNFVSALEFDNLKISTWDKSSKESFNLNNKIIKYNSLWEDYKPLEIKNTYGLGKTLFKGALIEHTKICEGSHCYSIMEIYTSGDEPIYTDIIFKTQQSDGNWRIQNVRNYKLSYYGVIDDYGYKCI